MHFNRKYGFTVAEILITTAIIGILAVLFVVGINSHNQSAWLKSKDYKLGTVKYNSVFNLINYSFNAQMMINNDVSGARLQNVLNNALDTLNYSCSGVSCTNLQLNATRNIKGAPVNNSKYRLADGVEVNVYSTNETIDGNENISYIIYVDTNGRKNPNKIAQDILPIYVDINGNLINVSPKTGKAFEKKGQKKYSEKIYNVTCSNGETMQMKKNARTGLYEVVGKSCAKCNIDDAPKTLADYINKEKGTSLSSSNINVNLSTSILSYSNDYWSYTAQYNPKTCIVFPPTRTCTPKGGLQAFEKLVKADSSQYGVYESSNTESTTNTIHTKIFDITATYDDSCTPTNISKTCNINGAKSTFGKLYPSATIDEIGNGNIKAHDSDYKYEGTYNLNSCAPNVVKTEVCSKNKAEQKIKDAIYNQYKTTVTQFSWDGNKLTAKTSDGKKKYTADYLDTDLNKCYANLQENNDCVPGGAYWPIYDRDEDIQYIREHLNCNFKLMEDWNLKRFSNWEPIGSRSYNQQFTGNFDGQNHKITGLTIKYSTSDNGTGLFGEVDGEIKNLQIHGANITSTNDFTGTLTGSLYGSVNNVAIINTTINGADYTGGIAGRGADFTNSYVTGTIKGKSPTGGLSGWFYGSATNSYFVGTVSGEKQVGGLGGSFCGSIHHSYADATVKGNNKDFIGMLTGDRTGGNNISNSYSPNTGNMVGAGRTVYDQKCAEPCSASYCSNGSCGADFIFIYDSYVGKKHSQETLKLLNDKGTLGRGTNAWIWSSTKKRPILKDNPEP